MRRVALVTGGTRGIGLGIARAALLTQYSPRFVEATVAEVEVTLTMHPAQASSAPFCSSIHRATAWVRK